MSGDPFGKTYLVLVRRAEDAAACRKRVEAGNQCRMRVTEQERSVGHHVIDVRSTVAIVGVRAAPAHLHERRPADPRAATYRRTSAAREWAVERDHRCLPRIRAACGEVSASTCSPSAKATASAR